MKRARSLVLLLVALTMPVVADSRQEGVTAYPNELPDFRLYDQYFSRIIPLVSTSEDVTRRLGQETSNLHLGKWRVWILYAGKIKCDGKDQPSEVTGRVATIMVAPTERIPMGEIAFPPTFKSKRVYVSHAPGPFEVYEDDYGLEYWICTTDSEDTRKGDLWRITYSAPRELSRRLWGC